jgi:hypothetical protein
MLANSIKCLTWKKKKKIPQEENRKKTKWKKMNEWKEGERKSYKENKTW